MGARPDDPTGPTHSGYRQYSIAAVLSWSVLGFVVGVALNLGMGYYEYEKAYEDVVLGVWEVLDPDSAVCKFSESVQRTSDFTLGMPESANKYTYGIVCDTDFATPENGYVACRIDNLYDYGCPASHVQWYSYFVNETLSGALNQEINLNRKPIICCVDKCPEWTQHWYCAPEHYNDSKICDCECGYPDPDCAPDVEIAGFRGCCHEDYVAFGTDHLVGCLNGSSPGDEYQQRCYEEMRCNEIYTAPSDILPFPCTFQSVRNEYTMPLEIAGREEAMTWLYMSPLTGLGLYILCVASYPLYALLCGLCWRPNRRKVMNEASDPPPKRLSMKRNLDDLDA